jgi:penicillin-binding protein 1A
VDRASGKKVFGVFPTTNDPKPSVIWEAFQPQTEPRRAYRHSQARGGEEDQAAPDPRRVVRRPARPRTAQSPAPVATPAPLPTQNTTG